MVLAEIMFKLSDESEISITFFQDKLLLIKFCAWDNSSEYVRFCDEPELEDIWDGCSWNLVMLTNLCEQFDFSEVM